MDRIAGISTSASTRAALSSPVRPPPAEPQLKLEQAFQDFVAGTFYKEMLKSLRRSHTKPAYFHGGPAEELFQNQLDQTMAESLAREHGRSFSGPLFTVFEQQIRSRSQNPPPREIEPSEMVSALGDAVRRK